MNRKTQIIIAISLTVLLVVMVLLNRRKKNKEIEEIRERIKTGGVSGGNTIRSILNSSVATPSGFDSYKLVEQIKDGWDSDRISAFKGLSKGQIKHLMNEFSNSYGDLDKFLYDPANTNLVGWANGELSEDEYNEVLDIVRNAR